MVIASDNELAPAQAMEINGVYLEHLITGYRTLSVEGREDSGYNVETIDIRTRDGAKYKRRKLKSRILTVKFEIQDDTPEGFEEKYNQLKYYLSGIEEAQLIFKDEPDKYYTGTLQEVSTDFLRRNASTGTIKILCADPLKYSVTEYEVAAENNAITVDYGGTYPAHPILTAQSATHDCGYYTFTDADGYFIQVGDPEEEDQEEVTHEDDAVTVIDHLWGYNGNITNEWQTANAVMMYDYILIGNMTNAADYAYVTTTFPDASVYSFYVGDAYGHNFETTYPSWELSVTHWFAPTTAQGGGFDFYVNNADGTVICGFSIWHDKNDMIRWSVIVNGKVVKRFYCAYTDNPFAAWVTSKITKVLNEVTFNIGGEVYTITSPAINSSAYDASNLTWVMYRKPSDEDPAANNALKEILFRSIPSTWDEVANKIPTNGAVEVDTGSGEITVNGTESAGLGTVDNDFEHFVLDPGENTITCSASDWVDDAAYTMRYREVFL